MKIFRIVTDGITSGCPIYRIDRKHLFYWELGAFDFAPNYRCYSIEGAIHKIHSKYPKAKIYYKYNEQEIEFLSNISRYNHYNIDKELDKINKILEVAE